MGDVGANQGDRRARNGQARSGQVGYGHDARRPVVIAHQWARPHLNPRPSGCSARFPSSLNRSHSVSSAIFGPIGMTRDLAGEQAREPFRQRVDQGRVEVEQEQARQPRVERGAGQEGGDPLSRVHCFAPP